MHAYLIDLLVFLAAAVITVPIFRFFGIGAILAYLFAGVLIGPSGFKIDTGPPK